jgi:transcriptional regulator with XRE-family HTH domain
MTARVHDPPDDVPSFAGVLLARRLAAGLTQGHVSRVTGIHKHSLSAYENGHREPPPVHRYALRMLFELDENADDGWWRVDW